MKRTISCIKIPIEFLPIGQTGGIMNGMQLILLRYVLKTKRIFFGRIYMDSHENAVVLLSEIGMIANKYWLEIPKHFPFVVLGSYIIMPNHIHSIIAIHRDVNLEESAEEYSNNWTPESLGVIINQYKRACTLNAKKLIAILDGNQDFMII